MNDIRPVDDGAPGDIRPAAPVDDDAIIRQRQRSRSIVTGLILGAMAILFYAIAIAKMTGAGG